jgi:hypothetical protein
MALDMSYSATKGETMKMAQARKRRKLIRRVQRIVCRLPFDTHKTARPPVEGDGTMSVEKGPYVGMPKSTKKGDRTAALSQDHDFGEISRGRGRGS